MQAGIFIAQINKTFLRRDGTRGDQHAFEKAVRIALHVIAVLESAGLALIGIDREQAGLRLGQHEAPFSPGRKARAAEAAQLARFKGRDDILDICIST